MKWNWGKGIVVVILSFICFIMYFVIKMSVDDSYNHELVTENYYAKEMTFQEDILAQENALYVKDKFEFKKTNEGLMVTFPQDLEPQSIKGKVFLYRPSNKALDIDFPIVLSGFNLLIPDKHLVSGLWNISFDFEHKNKRYLIKKEMIY